MPTAVALLKWCGGKQRLMPELISRLPVDVSARRYVEPFVGGGALFFALQPRSALLADANAELINALTWVRDTPALVAASLEMHASEHDEDRYVALRRVFNTKQLAGTAAQAALFVYLNRTCFNGLWRVNKRGDFNVPSGKRGRSGIADAKSLHNASAVLQFAELSAADFEPVLDTCGTRDFVYLDPPYLQDAEQFTTYTAAGFTVADHTRLATACRELNARGAKFLLSNADTEDARKLYFGFRVEAVEGRDSVGAAGKTRKVRPEILVRNY